MRNNPTISTHTIFTPQRHSHHLSLLPLAPPNPNHNTLPPPSYPKPLNPLALPYQKEPTSPPSPPKMEQTSLLLSKPYLPHEIYQQLPPQVPAPFVVPSNYYYSSSTLIYQHGNSNFPTFFTQPPPPPPPVLPPRSYYTLNNVPSSPSPLPPPSDDQKNKATVTKFNTWRRRRRGRFSLPSWNMTYSEKSSWVPKNHSSLGTEKRVGNICADVERKEKEAFDLRGKTSLMIRNIPNQFTEGLMRILDNHCWKENKKVLSAASNPVWSEYDFLYLPMDFRRLANLGYAFVNFTSEVAATRFWKAFNGHTWRVSKNQKTCEIAPALIQGKEGSRMHFRNSIFRCHTDGYLPVTFSPPRNGSTLSEPRLVGERVEATALTPTIRRKSRS